MDDIRLYVCIVAYNTLVSEITAINKLNTAEIVIADNTTDEDIKKQNKSFCAKIPYFHYLDMKGNAGLSTAYNRMIDYVGTTLITLKNRTWLMFCDDDTSFPEEYFQNVFNAMKEGFPIISGIVKTNNNKHFSLGLISKSGFHSGKIETPGTYKNIYCINSGLTIRFDIFQKNGLFSEKLFLDLIDYEFMYRLQKNGLNNIYLVDGEIIQNFSGESRDEKSEARRYNIYVKDFKQYCKLTNRPWYYKTIVIIKRKAHLLYKYRTTKL